MFALKGFQTENMYSRNPIMMSLLGHYNKKDSKPLNKINPKINHQIILVHKTDTHMVV